MTEGPNNGIRPATSRADFTDALIYTPYASTDRQREILASLSKTLSSVITAKDLGVSQTEICKVFRKIKARAAAQGFAPEHDYTRTVPDGFVLKGVSSYYGKEGTLRGQWVKSSADR